MNILTDPRFAGIEKFEKKVWLATPTMHGDEQHWVDEAIKTNWVSTVGANINAIEEQMAEYIGVKYAVGLSCGTAALHLATKLAGEKLYGQAKPNHGTLEGRRVFASDCTFDASINPIAYEDGEAIFIDTEPDTWNMSPEALKKAFEDYLYKSVPGKSSPQEVLDALSAFNAEGRPIWKPMHMQPIYRTHAFITAEGNGRGRTNAYIAGSGQDVGADIFHRGLCLPSDNKMTPSDQDRVIEIIHRCFR